jgi:uncharacterized protein DUF3500
MESKGPMAMKDWTEFGLRHLPQMSARTRVESVPPMQGLIDAFLTDSRAALAAPVCGVTTGGHVVPGLFTTRHGAVDTAPLREAALAFLAALEPADGDRASLPLEAGERRAWSNVHPNFLRHGVMLADLTPSQREYALALLRATLSACGFAQGRDIMRLNELLAAVSGSSDEFGEWSYFVSIFGMPSDDAPWGWQLDGPPRRVRPLAQRRPPLTRVVQDRGRG